MLSMVVAVEFAALGGVVCMCFFHTHNFCKSYRGAKSHSIAFDCTICCSQNIPSSTLEDKNMLLAVSRLFLLWCMFLDHYLLFLGIHQTAIRSFLPRIRVHDLEGLDDKLSISTSRMTNLLIAQPRDNPNPRFHTLVNLLQVHDDLLAPTCHV